MAPTTKKGIDVVIANIEKALGFKGERIIKRFSDIKDGRAVEVISFGIPEVDAASNCGGIPRGKIVEMFGPESGGKSLLSLKLIASAQAEGRKCCLIDAEHSFDPKWAARHGVDVDNLFIVNELLSAEKILDVAYEMCNAKDAFDLVVIDSTAALIPEKELEGSIGDQDYALLARAMSKGCRKIMSACGQTLTTCVFLNQIREKMNAGYGDTETTPGGRALKFYSHMRIRVRPGATIKDDVTEAVIGRISHVKFVKNKTANPMGEGNFRIIFDKSAENPIVKLVTLARSLKVITVRSGTYKLPGELMGKDKNIETGCASMVDVADWVVKNNVVIPLIEATLTEAEGATEEVKIDPIIRQMLEDESLIVSPLVAEETIVGVVSEDGE